MNRDVDSAAMAGSEIETAEEETERRMREGGMEGTLQTERSTAYFMGSLGPQCRFISHYLSAKAG